MMAPGDRARAGGASEFAHERDAAAVRPVPVRPQARAPIRIRHSPRCRSRRPIGSSMPACRPISRPPSPISRLPTGLPPATSSWTAGGLRCWAQPAAFRLPLICRRSICAAGSSCRASSTCTPISTRDTSGRAAPTRTAPMPAPAWRSPPTARRTGAPTTCARAWISRCVAPSPTAAARSAPISIRSASKPPSPGRSSPRCASNGRTALRCKPSRSSRSISRSMTNRSSAPSRRRSPATAAFWAALRSSAKSRDRSSSSRSTGCSAWRSQTVSTSICTSTKAARPMR